MLLGAKWELMIAERVKIYSAPALVDILEACLVHRMYAVGADNQLRDSPHCKIALEVLSTLFMVRGHAPALDIEQEDINHSTLVP
jgi:hypothetical protein